MVCVMCMTIVMPPGPVSCIGGTKYPNCIVLYCTAVLYGKFSKWAYLLVSVCVCIFNCVTIALDSELPLI